MLPSHFKGRVAWQILVNTIYVFFWTTARQRMDLINGSQRLNLYMASVSRMLPARGRCGRVVRSRISEFRSATDRPSTTRERSRLRPSHTDRPHYNKRFRFR